MTRGPELFTLEHSHGKPRITRPRPTDLESVPTGEDRNRDHRADGTFKPGNQAAVGRGARTALRAPYKAAEKRIAEAMSEQAEPAVADLLLRDALAIFAAARAELGSRSVFSQGPTIAYAIETTLAGYFVQEAARAGFLTELGMQLHDRAMACETHAARAMTAALAAAKALAGKRPRKGLSIVEQIELAARNAAPSSLPTPTTEKDSDHE